MISARLFCELVAKKDYVTLNKAYIDDKLHPKWSWVTRLNPLISLEEEFLKITGTTRPICRVCNQNHVSTFISFEQGYNLYCSKSCAKLDPEVEQKKKNTLALSPDWKDKARAKSKKTNLAKYGVVSPLANKEILAKRKNTNLKKYGAEEVLSASSKVRSVITNDIAANKVFSRIETFANIVPNFSVDEFSGADNYYQWTCVACNTQFSASLNDGNIPRCTRCNPRTSSAGEHEMRKYVESLIDEEVIQRHKINKMEIDIFIPSKSIGFEFNGIYWHSEQRGTSKDYHLVKKQKCAELGITLLQFWDYQWYSKKEIVKSIIANSLGKTSKIFARKCSIKELTEKESSNFLNANHLSGNANGAVLRLGLIYNNTLVAVSTFCKPRFGKSDGSSLEILRFANKINYSVVGGANKLLRAAINKIAPETVISFCDEMCFSGNVYKSLGFTKVDSGKPAAWYFSSDGVLKHRTTYQKKKLLKLLGLKSSELTEWELAKQLKLNRVWDCGNSKWKLDVVSNR